MRDCRKIKPLLHLYREGELSEDEKTRVVEHIKTCSRCRVIHDQLLSIDAALKGLRAQVPEAVSDPGLVGETIDLISKKKDVGGSGEYLDDLLDLIFSWLRPALSLTLIAAAILFVTQQARDSIKVAELENRLSVRGNVVAAEASSKDNLASLQQRAKKLMSSKPSMAAIVSDPSGLLGSGLMELFRHNPGLFEVLSRRYPNLSSITLDDGLDDRERKILATEGKALIKEFEQLVHEGEK